jgi:hypothetical protein
MPTTVDVHCHLMNCWDVPATSLKRLVGPASKVVARILRDQNRTTGERTAVAKLIAHRVAPGFEQHHGVLSGLGRVVQLLVSDTATIAGAMIATHPEVDLFTPMMVDLEKSYEPDPQIRTPREQLAAFQAETRRHLGQVHPLVSFCPRRAALDPGGIAAAIALVQEALDSGFIGVKLYPPTGFQASGNTAGYRANPYHGAPLVSGDAIDAALTALYTYCAQNDVPITAHCSPGCS